MKSLQLRLNAGLAMSLVLLFILLWFASSLGIRQLTEHQIETRLGHDTENILTAIDTSSNTLSLDTTRVDAIYRQPFSGHYFVITDPHGTVIRSRSLWDTELEQTHVTPGKVQIHYLPGPEQQTLLVRSAGYIKQGRRLVISTAEDLSPMEQQIAQLQWWALGIFLVTLFMVIIIQRFIITSSLKPLHATRAELKRLTQGELLELREEVPAELLPLVHEINQLLKFNHQRLQRSRSALGNLAHALKSPLTLLLQLAQESPLQQHPEFRDRLMNHALTIQNYIERELKRARLAGNSHHPTRNQLSTTVDDLKQALLQIYRDKELTIDSQVPDTLHLSCDLEDLNELLGNIMDNACKWAAHRVQISATAQTDIEILIEDDGPGVSTGMLSRLSQRGVRLDETTPGHGLGLAIAREIMELYQGSLDFSRSATLGGLKIRILFPNPPADECT